MPVQTMQADAPNAPVHHYYACPDPDCGMCLSLRPTRAAALMDGLRHRAAKRKAAAA
jgi:hypothetical protein